MRGYNRFALVPIISGLLFFTFTIITIGWFISNAIDSDDYTPFVPRKPITQNAKKDSSKVNSKITEIKDNSVPASSKNASISQSKNTSKNSSSDNSTSPKADVTTSAPKVGSMEWVNEKIRQHKDEIDKNDLADFRNIFSKINMGHVNTLLSDSAAGYGGIEVRVYLHSILSQDEYARAKQLFARYNGLIYD
jgi:hypothetical protein